MLDAKQNPLDGLTIEQYGSQLRSGRLSAEETTLAYLDRIAKFDQKLGSYTLVDTGRALESARAIDASIKVGFDFGPLMGVPVAVKDLYEVDNLPLKAGSRLDISGIVSREGTLIRALRRGGCIILGKTWTSEFALGGINFLQKVPWNPWDSGVHLTPGGSSGGSAVAEAAGLCAFALGTDTGGSVRMPAALCGVLGHKFAADAFPRDGIFPLSSTLDSVGTFTSCAADSATIFTALTGITVPEVRIKGLRVGKPEGTFYQDLDREVDLAMNQALSRLASAGAEIVPVTMPEILEVEWVFGRIVPIELIAILGTDRIKHGFDKLDPVSQSRIQPALQLLAVDYISARMRQSELRRRIADYMDRVDCWITPATPGIATPLADIPNAAAAATWNRRALRNTRPDNVFGNCGVSLPLPDTVLPVGLQITCTPGNDARLLGITRAIELIVGRTQRPDVSSFSS